MAQATALIEFVEESWGEWKALAPCGVVARINHDDCSFETSPWIVTVSGREVHRANTLIKAQNWVSYHFKNNTLPLGEWEKVEVAEVKEGDRVEILNTAASVECVMQEEDCGDVKLAVRAGGNTRFQIKAKREHVIMRQKPQTQTVAACDLRESDRIVKDGKVLVLRQKTIYFKHLTVWDTQYRLMLLPGHYRYKAWEGDRYGEDYHAHYHAHLEAERKRLFKSVVWIVSSGSEEFQVLRGAA